MFSALFKSVLKFCTTKKLFVFLLKQALNNLFFILIETRIPFGNQGFSLNLFSFLVIVLRGTCLLRTALKVVIRLQTSLLMLEFDESKSIFDRFLFISTGKSSRLKFFMQRNRSLFVYQTTFNFWDDEKSW